MLYGGDGINSNLIPHWIWSRYGGSMILILSPMGFGVLSSDLKPLSNARDLFDFNPATPTAA